MATLLKTYYGTVGSTKSGNSQFRCIVQVGYDKTITNGYHIQTRKYIECIKGSSSDNFTNYMQTTWASGYFSLGVTGKVYADSGWKDYGNLTYGQSISFSERCYYKPSSSVTYESVLSAKYSLDAPTYTVSYNANGGTGAPGSQTKTYGTNLTLSSTKPTRTGYTFLRWNTNNSGTGTNYDSGASYTANAAVTLYAVWEAVKAVVTFKGNGLNVADVVETYTYGASNQSFGMTKSDWLTRWSRPGYELLGWSASAGSTTATYQVSATVSNTWIAGNVGNVTLYAVWKQTSNGYIKTSDGKYHLGILYQKDVDGKYKVVMPYRKASDGKYKNN